MNRNRLDGATGDILIRPDGMVERLDLPEPAALAGSYAAAVPPHRRDPDRAPRERRTRARYPEHLLRGRLVNLLG
jgi:hypothetical protein